MANIPISSFTAAANATGIGLSGYSLTGSNAQSIIDLAGTWNTSGTPTGVKLNITDTASNAASLLMDLQVGGTSRFSVRKDGRIFGGNTQFIDMPSSTTGIGIGAQNSGNNRVQIGGNVGINSSLNLGSTANLNWSSSSTDSFSTDLTILRDAANILAQRNGVSAQTSRIYNTYTDASNYERLAMRFTSNAFYISSERAGTGTQRSVSIGSDSGAGSLIRLNVDGSINFFTSFSSVNPWNINTSGHFISPTDNTYDIGASGATRPRNLYMASWIRMATTTVASLPAAATAGAGARMFVTDAASPTFGSAVTGGGAVTVPVYSTGSAWNVG
jgi:hypothetical protein